MAKILEDISKTFNKFLIMPNLIYEKCITFNVSLKNIFVKYEKDEEIKISKNIQFVLAIVKHAVSKKDNAITFACE